MTVLCVLWTNYVDLGCDYELVHNDYELVHNDDELSDLFIMNDVYP